MTTKMTAFCFAVREVLAHAPGPVELRFDTLSDEDLDALAHEHGGQVTRDVHFNTNSTSCPCVFPYLSIYLSDGKGRITASGKMRQATAAEIDAHVAKIKEKIEHCCKPQDLPLDTNKLIKGDF